MDNMATGEAISDLTETDPRYVLDFKRTKKLTEKGLQYQMDQLDKKYRSLNRLEKYLTEIAHEDDEPLSVVQKKYCIWMEEYEKFLELYDLLFPQVEIDEKSEFIRRFEERNNANRQFKSWINNYITVKCKEVMSSRVSDSQTPDEELTEKLDRPDEHVGKISSDIKSYNDDDKLSVVSSKKSSVSSRAGSYVSVKRIKEEQKRVELEARKLTLSKKREIEMNKLALKLQEEELELDTNIAVSQARSKVFEKYDPTEDLTLQVTRGLQSLHIEEPRFTSPFPLTTRCPTRFIEDPITVTPLPEIIDQPSQPVVSSATETKGTPLVNSSIESTKGMINSVVQHLRKPVPEIKKFGGNPLEYRRFLRQFKAKIIANTDDDDERMNYLEQLTHSDAHKVVAGFSHLTGDKAYNAAMKQLEDRYGDEDVIASAFIQKALNWPSVRVGDAKALDEFALFLVECENGVSDDSSGVLEYSENIKRLMFKLPYHLHDRWRTNVLKLKDAKKRVKFKDFVNFVKVEAKKINDPTYGSVAMGTQKVTDKSSQRTAGNQKTKGLSNVVSDIETTKTDNDSKCSFCDLNSHSLNTCKKFMIKSLQEKYDHIKEKGMCFGCLKKGHMSKKCRNRSTCNVCGKRHPSILHDDSKKPSDSEQTNSKQREVSNATSVCSLFVDDQIGAGDVSCAMAIIPVKLSLKTNLIAS